jgi:hypothetical protein
VSARAATTASKPCAGDGDEIAVASRPADEAQVTPHGGARGGKALDRARGIARHAERAGAVAAATGEDGPEGREGPAGLVGDPVHHLVEGPVAAHRDDQAHAGTDALGRPRRALPGRPRLHALEGEPEAREPVAERGPEARGPPAARGGIDDAERGGDV